MRHQIKIHNTIQVIVPVFNWFKFLALIFFFILYLEVCQIYSYIIFLKLIFN